MNVLISACLIGVNCRYDGNGFETKIYENLHNDVNLIPVCSEQLGGLETPRSPVEIRGNKAFNKKGDDVTKNFLKGAEEVLNLAKKFNCRYAILKSNSPSCGHNLRYDGTFSGRLIEGNGLTADLLAKNGIIIFNEKNYFDLKKCINK